MANPAITTPASEAVHSTLIDPGIKKYWFDEFKQLAPKLDKILKVGSMDEAYEVEQSYAGLGELPLVAEGATYTEDAVLETYATTYTPAKYGEFMTVTHELWDDQREKIAGKTQSAARAAARKIESLAASMFNNGFDTAYTSYGDTKPLFSVSHTRADGGTAQSNASATSITLTEANLETGILAMRNTLDDRGNLLDVVPNCLIVPPALEKEALIITKSDKRSETTDNDANVYGMTEYTGGKLNVIVWNYLGAAAGGSDTAWFLLDKPQHKISWKWRVKPRITMQPEAVGAKNDVWHWKTNFRAAYGWSNWVAAWASQGTGAAYAS